MYKFIICYCLVWLLSGCTAKNVDQSNENLKITDDKVEIVQVREDTFAGNPEGKSPPPVISKTLNTKSTIVDGVYKSKYQGYEISVPNVFGDNQINVHVSLVSKRDDGTAITSHVLFVPSKGYGVSGLVVTRISDEKLKYPNSVLESLKPRTKQEYITYKNQGVVFKSYTGKHGDTLERVVVNRVYTPHFPYRYSISSSTKPKSIGISRYFVEGKFLYEATVVLLSSSALGKGETFYDVAIREVDLLTAQITKYAE